MRDEYNRQGVHGSRNRYHIATWVGFDVGGCDVHSEYHGLWTRCSRGKESILENSLIYRKIFWKHSLLFGFLLFIGNFVTH